MKEREVYWRWSGDPRQPHALGAAGDHLTGFANIGELGTHIDVRVRATAALVKLVVPAMSEIGFRVKDIDWIVGSGYSSNFWSDEGARQMGVRRSSWTDKAQIDDPENPGKKKDVMVMRHRIPPHSTVLQWDDMHTTGHTAELTRLALLESEPTLNIVPIAPAPFVWGDKFPYLERHGYRVIPLLRREMKKLKADACKHDGPCAHGSQVIKPKLPGNWAKLTASFPARQVA